MNQKKNIGNIMSVSISKDTFIGFQTTPDIHFEDYVEIILDDKTYYFKVEEVSATDTASIILICAKAKQVGYWANNLNAKKDLNIENLLGISIHLVEDTETIKRIREASSYC